MSGSDPLRVKELFSHDHYLQSQAQAAILNKFGYFAAVRITAPLSRIAFMDPVELADHACTAFRNRLARELALGPQATPPIYAQLEIDSTEFDRVVATFLRNSASSLARSPRYQMAPDSVFPMVAAPSLLPGAELEMHEEEARLLQGIRNRCSPAELRIVEALLATGCDREQAAVKLGLGRTAIDQAISRLRKKCSELDR